VGAIAAKDCLAHHRYGDPGRGGDEYSDGSALARMGSWLHEHAQQRQKTANANAWNMLDRALRRFLRLTGHLPAGAWFGNDTCWRMTLDIARILRFADSQGRLRDEAMRRHLMLVDGVVGGQGDGPLVPDPAPSGVLLLADDIAAGDRACARLMGFDPERIALLREAPATADPSLVANGRTLEWAAGLHAASHRFAAPRGWRGHIENRPLSPRSPA
jgi:hypothetical protein